MIAFLSLIVGLFVGYFVGVYVIMDEIVGNPAKVNQLSEAFTNEN